VIIQIILAAQLLAPAQASDVPVSTEAAALLQSGVDAETRGELDQAISNFQKAAELAPSSSVALLRLGDAYMRKHDFASAIPPLKHAADLSPDSVAVHKLLGYALLSQGYASEAITHLRIAQDSAALGIAQLETDQPAEAIINLKDALAKNPNDPDLIYYLGRAGNALSSGSKDRLLSESPLTARGHQTLGENYYAARMFPEAEKEYGQAIALRPDLPDLHLELGEIYAATSQWVRAEEQFRVETKLQPGNAEAAYRLGDALLRQGKMKDAAEELRRSDSLRPDMPETLYALGRALAVSDPSAAEHALNRVIAIEKQTPLAAQAYLTLAGIHRKSGNPELAAREMEQYRKVQNLSSVPAK
jgi:tetratricopeptide (TPR) repeat protein